MQRCCLLLTAALFPLLSAQTVPSPFRLNQLGYLPAAPKVALLVAPATAAAFEVRRTTDDRVVFTGPLGPATADPDSGDTVQAADFSTLQKIGTYYLSIPGNVKSPVFRIEAAIYQSAWYLVLRSFYGQRCGIAVDLGSRFPGYRYPACHLQGAWHPSSGKTGPRASIKGWHDAGDYGRYMVNSGITTGTLLWAWEFYAPTLTLNIPESNDTTPDILDEVRWNLDWMASLQDDDGGVFHKQTTERFSGFVMPDKDTAPSYVIGSGAAPYKTSCATGDFAAVMAIAARAYQPHDAAFATRALSSARRAWSWLERNPAVVFRNPSNVATGEYGDEDCRDERLWAAAELWRTTGDPAFHRFFLREYSTIHPANPPGWANAGNLALWTYLLATRAGADSPARDTIRKQTLAAADDIVARTARNPYRHSLATADYVWGSNGVAANYGLQLLVAHRLQPDPRYRHAALDNLHYLLGRNTLGLSWITAVGARPYRHPHHRPSAADSNPEPWPGLLAGGPNRNRQDPLTRKLPALPPAKIYLDEEASYSTNEIAMNWNAPLVFLLSATLSAH